jgi:bifunctional NMN adenylyltransferase/nudix hydrolase
MMRNIKGSALSYSADVAVLIGRFQPFHNGHATLLRTALDTADSVVIVLGSSFHARSTKNPFTWQERASMIRATLGEGDVDRVQFVPVRDYYDDIKWSKAVMTNVQGLFPDAKKIALVGFMKDASSYYLDLFPSWMLINTKNTLPMEATHIRSILFESEDMAVSMAILAELLPLQVRQYLKGWLVLGHLAKLLPEYEDLQKEKRQWAKAPYPPVFTTVDSIVEVNGHVLLIKRGGKQGNGLWALPGGFLEQRERLMQGAIRELTEETNLGVLKSTLQEAFVRVEVFDHADRSLRGRTITHVHYFDLKCKNFPEIHGGDDASLAKWFPISSLASMEDQFFEDHFHMLNYFFRISI